MIFRIQMILCPIVLLFFSAMLQGQTYPTKTIEEIQFVSNPEVDDASPFVGDTVEVRGMLTSSVRSLSIGPRWAGFILNPNLPTDPWQGLLVVQNDSTITGTDFGTLIPGDVGRFTGVVTEFEGFTQLTILTDPLVPVFLETLGNVPPPIVLSTEDLSIPENAEQWESQYVRIPNAEVLDNNFESNRAVISDSTGIATFMDDYFRFFRDRFDNNTYSWPANSSTVAVQGFVRNLMDGYSINPRNLSDLTLIDGPPTLATVFRDPVIITSSDDAIIGATITDNNSVASALIHYSINNDTFLTAPMTANGDIWSGEIPAQTDDSYLRYFITATDADANTSMFPNDTSRATGSILQFFVRDNGLPIEDIQNTQGYSDDDSPYHRLLVEVEGVVMSDLSQFSGYFIQDAAAPWSGIFIKGLTTQYAIGDNISVFGRVVEDFGHTMISEISSDLEVAGVGPFDPVEVQTGILPPDGRDAEQYESVLMQVRNITITDAFPDGLNNFGEFVIDDGSGEMLVDDLSAEYEGNLDESLMDGMMGDLRGHLYYQFSRYKLEPRDSNDVQWMSVGIEDDVNLPSGFELKQNYPNPFNPSTTISYTLPAGFNETVSLTIYNKLGQKVRTFSSLSAAPGKQEVVWDARDNAGRTVASGVYVYRLQFGELRSSKKMLLLR
ncbi:MAG: FlgD immunoglobulin-like domain containing protein [Calditrichia bacterium]